MSVDNVTSTFPAADRQRPAPQEGDPLAIQVEDLHKAFRIPTHRVDSLKERMVRPFAARDYKELRALDGVSFEIRQGEFFGIVGRNGSGKSTLLKLLASIYRADRGKIRMAGRLAPFIELGVGFNVELTARENAVLNGVMMGLTPAESRRRLDAVIEFAELEEFIDLKLKNYSSGMLVRLAFSLMLEVDADILLIDEVLAVGDAAFQQKCADAFREMKAAGKTIVLVTHEMTSVEEYCHRAMLINDGQIQQIGDPGEVGRHYLQLNFERGGDAATQHAGDGGEDLPVRMIDARLEGASGSEGRVGTVEHGEQVHLAVELEAREDFKGLDVGFLLANADGVGVATLTAAVGGDGYDRPVAAGQRIVVRSKFENPLGLGHYFVHCGVNRAFEGGIALYVHNAIEFIVYGASPGRGLIALENTTTAEIEAGGSA
jgi:ABC-2 type transport system ATP-binding protein